MASGAVPAGAGSVPDHSSAYRTRRFLNWFPLGLAYAFLYMGRYNLTVSKNALGALMTNEDFGIIFGVGTIVYGFSFLLNGPLTEKIGGRITMLIAIAGSAAANLAMGMYLQSVVNSGSANNQEIRLWFSVLYAVNMYFQSFGAVAIVTVNSSWFHVRERGGFSGIFGTMISSGIFLAYSVNDWVLRAVKTPGISDTLQTRYVFFLPAALLAVIFVVEFVLLRDRPSLAGHSDFDTGAAVHADDNNANVTVWQIFARLLRNPIVLTIAAIEFCTGIIRQGVMQWYPIYAKSVLALPSEHPMRSGQWSVVNTLPFFAVGIAFFIIASRVKTSRRRTLFASGGLICLIPFLQAGWGGILMVAGVIGGNVAGWVSDVFFQSRRAPAAGGLYFVLIIGALAAAFTLGKTLPVVQSSSVEGLKPGDKIVEVAGQGDLTDWVAVSNAFAAVPAPCTGGSLWDSKNKMCSSDPAETDAAVVPSNGVIAVLVERDGQRITVDVKDPGMKMRAGDRRTLRASPVTTQTPYLLGAIVFIMSLAVIGTHGLLSGTATMDFGGKKGTSIAVGLIDGAVYLGTAVQALSLGYITSRDWSWWPWFMVPFAVIGFLFCRLIWNATARKQAPPGVPPTVGSPAGQPASAAGG